VRVRVGLPAFARAARPPVDLVLVSHNHYDHLQPSSLRLFADRAAYVAPLGVGSQLNVPSEGASYTIESNGSVEREKRRTAFPQDPVVSAFRRKIHELDW